MRVLNRPTKKLPIGVLASHVPIHANPVTVHPIDLSGNVWHAYLQHHLKANPLNPWRVVCPNITYALIDFFVMN